MTYVDALGRTHYTQYYSQRGAVNSQPADSNVTAITESDDNALNLPTKVIQTDLTPQTNQSTTSVTATKSYDDLGRLTSETDPDRWTDTYSYDQDGRVTTDVQTSGSSTKTIGTSYDLLGRARCVQDAAPTTNGSGACSGGSHALMQNTYDTSTLGTAGSTDFPVGELTKSVAMTYYPDGSASTSTEQFQHDNRGQLTEETMQLGVPSSWNVTTALPTYQLTESYNDADQPMTTQTTVGGQHRQYPLGRQRHLWQYHARQYPERCRLQQQLSVYPSRPTVAGTLERHRRRTAVPVLRQQPPTPTHRPLPTRNHLLHQRQRDAHLHGELRSLGQPDGSQLQQCHRDPVLQPAKPTGGVECGINESGLLCLRLDG